MCAPKQKVSVHLISDCIHGLAYSHLHFVHNVHVTSHLVFQKHGNSKCSASQIFKTLYVWDERREEVFSKPEDYLISDGLLGQAFMLHPFKYTAQSRDLKHAFWKWWTMSSCLNHSGIDTTWKVCANKSIALPDRLYLIDLPEYQFTFML